MKRNRNQSILTGILLLALLMICTAACAAGSGDCGDNVRWELSDAGHLRIYGTGPMTDFGYNGDVPWYENREQIRTAAVESGVTFIGGQSFSGCANLTKVTIAATVTRVGGFAFEDCAALTGVSFPAGLTVIDHEAFYGSGLKTAEIPSGVKRIESGTFARCGALASVTLPKGLEYIGEAAFYHCRAMESLTIPDTVTKIDRLALADCGLTAIALPESVTELGEYVFHNDPNLVSVRLSSHTGTLPPNAFNMCAALEEITLPDGMGSISYEAFSQCPELKKVAIPDSVTFMGANLFQDSGKVVIYCTQKSRADLYARDHAIPVVYTGIYIPPKTGGDLQAGETKAFSERYAVPASLSGEVYAMSTDEEVARVKKITYGGVINNEQLFTIEIEGVSPGLCSIRMKGNTDQGPVTLWGKIIVVSGKVPVYSVTVTVSDEDAGTAAADPVSGYAGTEVTLSYTENPGWKFREWEVVSGGVTVTENRFTLGKQNAKIRAVFEKNAPSDLSGAKISKIGDREYTGKAIKPKPSVTLNGTKLVLNRDYRISWKNNRNVGQAAVIITGIGDFTGTKKASFRIIPKKVTLSSLKAGSGLLTVKWKAGTGIDGYEIEYGLKKSFKGAKTVTVSGAETGSFRLRKLKAGKTYYVRIRAFKNVKGKVLYSGWSKVLSQKTK